MSRKILNEFLTESLDSPVFRRAFAQISLEKATRPVRPCRCVVVEIPEKAQTADFADITPGTVTAFVARKGEPLLRKLTETIKANNSKEFNSVTKQIKEMVAEVSRRIAGTGIHAKSQPQALPSFAEVSYANKTLIGYVYVDDVLRVNANAFPYNGGHLDKKKFSMIEYYGAASDTPLTCVLLIRQPKLSKIEREALRLVPSGSSANNIAAAVAAPFTPAILAILVAAAVEWVYNELVNLFVAFLHGSTTALASIPDAVLVGKDFQNKLKSLPPEVTAAELVQLRTDILLQKLPKRK